MARPAPLTSPARVVVLAAALSLTFLAARRPHPSPADTSAKPSPTDDRPLIRASSTTTWGAPDLPPATTPSTRTADPSPILPPDVASELSHALTLQPGAERLAALDRGLDRWTLSDPVATGDWLLQHLAALTDSEFDHAAARLIERTDAAHRPTALAREWAEGLADPALRFAALLHVVREWSGQDPDAARRYAESTAFLTPDQRHRLSSALRPPAPEI